MPTNNYKCNACGKVKEYSTVPSLPKSFRPPKDNKCEFCKKGTLEVLFSPQGQSFDVIGGYDYTYGKKNWKKNLSVSEQADVLTGDKDPY